ncbi:MAG TPA: TolC family protein [Polyangia bacterium]|nr:TolC family protein [Polyangia bacterium]
MIVVVAALVAAGGPVVQAAAEAAEGGPTVTLEKALELARQRNRSVIAERARLAQAQASVQQGWAALFPTLTAQGKYTHNNAEARFNPGGMPFLIQPVNQWDGSINGTAPLIVPAAYPALEAVKASARAADANFQVSEAQLLLSVAQTYHAAAVSEEVVLARQSNVEVNQATLKNAQVRFGAGTVTKVDVDRAELALVQAQQAERTARFGRDKTYRALATLIQQPLPFQVRTPNFPPEMHDERDLPRALELRPEFRALQESLRSSTETANANGWRWAPGLSGFGLARKFNYDSFTLKRYAWAVGLQLDWTLFDGGNRDAQRHLARAQAEETAARADVLRDSIRDDLADGRRDLETKQQGLQVAERSVELARETLALVRVQYEAGTVTQVDLLQAQDALVNTQQQLAQAHYDVAAADLTLRHAAGTFP